MARPLLLRWALSFIGTALLAAIVWFFGPLLSELAPPAIRVGIIAVMLLLWAGANWWIDKRNRRRDAALSAGVAEVDPKLAASADEVAALQERLSSAMDLLRRARGTRGYLYEQPWYVIIGPPGAGKTTALLNAGLRFPLAAEAGHAVPGVGGTRLCDWWFTDEAVLIDTAGRYTTQDSDQTVDRAGWEGFLDLLKRTRTRQPLNGVLVAIAIPDIVQSGRDARLDHARAVRRRVKEITARLGIRVPIYAVFTKADLLAGFTEFFDDLDSGARAQVWGTTFALGPGGSGGVLGRFPAEFDALVSRLDDRLFARLQAERSPDRRALLAGFPAQVASLEQPLFEFLAEAFGGSRLDPAPLLRGVYFSSGTQEGTPIDRLTSSLARLFGVDQRHAPSLKPQRGRSYFLQRLLKDVIFNEAMLVSEPPGAARRRRAMRAAGYVGALACVLAVGALLWQTRNAGEADSQRAAQALAGYEAKLRDVSIDPVADGDLPRLLPALDAARALPHGYDSGAIPTGWRGLGLGQNPKLATGAHTVYRHALEHLLLPRLIWRLEAQMRGNLQRPEFLYEATRIYLMLGSQGPLNPSLVKAWMQLDWEGSYPGPANTPVRQDLARHLDALLTEPLPPVSLDGALVQAARAVFSRVPLAERVYSRIRPSQAAQAVPPWRPADALGPAGVHLFVRASGKPMDDGVPGFFTLTGFYNVLLPALGRVAQDVANESWVLGSTVSVAPNSPELIQVEQGVIQLYEKDYAAQWDALLADLNLVPMRTLQAASQDLYLLSSPQSPMRSLLNSVARQLTLSQPPSAPQTPASAGSFAAAAGAPAAGASLQQLRSAFRAQAAGGTPPPPPGKEIDTRYAALREFVGSGPGAPIDGVLKLLSDLQGQLARLAATTPGTPPAAPNGDNPAALLQAEASTAPPPLSRWLAAIVSESQALRAGGARAEIAAAFTSSGGPADLCRAAVNGRYPFAPSASEAVPIADFAKLFAPGGLLDGFFNTQLRPYVDTSGPVWHARAADGVQLPVSPAALADFQRAAQIRDMFFGTGSSTPQVQFDLTPQSLDPGAKQVTLDLGGTKISYSHGSPVATQITWPGPSGMASARLAFDPPAFGEIEANGPWALFRLISQGQLIRQGSAESFLLTFQQGDRQASFSLHAGSVLNPFGTNVLRAFRCPTLQ